MKKLKVIVVNATTLKLEEPGSVGDIIDLLELQKVDSAPLLEAIETSKDEIYQSLLKKEIAQQEAQKKIALGELEKKLKQEYDALKLEKEKLMHQATAFEEKLKAEKTLTKMELSAVFAEEKTKLENEIIALKRDKEEEKKTVSLQMEKAKDVEIREKERQIELLKSEIKAEKERQVLLIEKEKEKVKAEYDRSISSKEQAILLKEAEIKLLNEQLRNKDDIKKAEIERELAKLNQKYGSELSSKDLELAQLKMSKSNLQVKMLGEELERWCNAEYESYALSGFDNCRFYKDNLAIKDAPDEKGTKADYIFEVYADSQKQGTDKLLSVCCEMKNESPETKTKTKNSDHYDKLEKDRIKKNCQYSLLISELEWDTINDSPIKKIPGYENMYMVRPAYFISFLSLIKSLANKYQSLLLEHKILDNNFKDSQAIIEEFENFKTTYLDKPLASLLKDVEEIKKEANKAYEASYKIVGLADTIISNKISEIKVKIDRFDIRKIAKRIEKLDA